MKPKQFKFDSSRKLKDYPTAIDDRDAPEDLSESVADLAQRIAGQQNLLYAEKRMGVVVLFQGMDAAGKDGAIKHVMSGLNPLGIEVTAFGPPSTEEQQRDFLWRSHVHLPPRGKVGIFNRSYYEEVLTVRLHRELLAAENFRSETPKDKFWRERFHDINFFESYLHHQGYRMLKFFLHISKKEQGKRLLKRIDDPTKNWKFDENDFRERDLWPKFMRAYDDCLRETGGGVAPWYVIPGDDKKTARWIVSLIFENSCASCRSTCRRFRRGKDARCKGCGNPCGRVSVSAGL